MTNLSKQYNNFSESFSHYVSKTDDVIRRPFYDSLTFDFKGKKLLDMACGDGQDIPNYEQRGAQCFGLDASEKLIEEAKKVHPTTEFKVGDMRALPYQDSSFDIVVSKYAVGTVEEVDTIFSEVARILKPGGMFAYLTTHPLRLFMEQPDSKKDYFTQKNVDLLVFGGAFTIVEPSHTFNEFFSPEYLNHFDMLSFSEHHDPESANFPGRDIYPDFFIVVGKKK
ncbi:MAG: class I SAM-dependent methyltransferase [Patescibacteria group bacterium]